MQSKQQVMKKGIILFILLFFTGLLIAQKGSGEFDNEIRIGPKTSVDSNQAGMIQYASGDFQGFDGATWKSFTKLGEDYAKVITVAQSGGDFTTIQAGINACGTTSSSNTCLVRVMPGIYNEITLTTQEHIHVSGAGKFNTTIQGQVIATDSCLIEGFFITEGVICAGVSPKIVGNHISNPFGDGIVVDGSAISANPWIADNDLRNCEGYGIRCTGGASFSFAANPWIIHNRIDSNLNGGIICTNNAWPTISNNQIIANFWSGIVLNGTTFPTEPTISDNVIADIINGPGIIGTGILLQNLAEPRIIANDIYGNKIGMRVLPNAQPSILSNNINYNDSIGIYCSSMGASKRVVIQGNHIHSNGLAGVLVDLAGNPYITQNVITHQFDGVFCQSGSSPIIAQNSIVQNGNADIFYSIIPPPISFPTINLNMCNSIIPSGSGAVGLYNVNWNGMVVNP